MFKILKQYISPFYMAIITPGIFWLISFGLYLGRYLRFNSWNVVNHPFMVVRQSFDVLLEKDTIGFTCLFSVFMWFLYFITLSLKQDEKV